MISFCTGQSGQHAHTKRALDFYSTPVDADPRRNFARGDEIEHAKEIMRAAGRDRLASIRSQIQTFEQEAESMWPLARPSISMCSAPRRQTATPSASSWTTGTGSDAGAASEALASGAGTVFSANSPRSRMPR